VPITKQALLDLLPPRLRERSLLTSLGYLLRDLLAIAALVMGRVRAAIHTLDSHWEQVLGLQDQQGALIGVWALALPGG
jgi:hypothetical protein